MRKFENIHYYYSFLNDIWNLFRNPPPSYAGGAMGGSAVDRFGADTDELLIVTED